MDLVNELASAGLPSQGLDALGSEVEFGTGSFIEALDEELDGTLDGDLLRSVSLLEVGEDFGDLPSNWDVPLDFVSPCFILVGVECS